MPRIGKRGREDPETYESDGGFISNDDGNAPKKKSKKTQAPPSNKDNTDSQIWELSTGRTPRRVEITTFKNMKLLNIREYYEKNSEYLPGKKGISLTVDQYKALLKAIPEINASLKEQGVDISEDAEVNDDDVQGTTEQKKKPRAKKETKSNIEETSDEEEG